MAAVTRPAGRRVAPGIGALLELAGVDGLGPASIRALVDAHGDPLEALVAAAAGAAELSDTRREAARSRFAGLSRRALRRRAEATAAAAEGELGPDDRILGYGDAGYPGPLGRLHAPPPVLWARGPLPAASARAVAIVGTRRATRGARELARDLGRGLAREGVRIVSGLAAGIDGAAHRGALDGEGETVAVLGSGLRFRYPRVNHDLYARLQAEGLILTEFAPSVRPEPHRFPTRNRIVAALCDAVVVVQAPKKSGALLTAGEAAEIGVEVLSCPGDPRLAGSAGCHDLLRAGAGLATGPEDVMAVLGWTPPAPGEGAGPSSRASRETEALIGEAERALLERLDREPAPLDELATVVGGVREAAVLLARLELDGRVAGLPGGRYAIRRVP